MISIIKRVGRGAYEIGGLRRYLGMQIGGGRLDEGAGKMNSGRGITGTAETVSIFDIISILASRRHAVSWRVRSGETGSRIRNPKGQEIVYLHSHRPRCLGALAGAVRPRSFLFSLQAYLNPRLVSCKSEVSNLQGPYLPSLIIRITYVYRSIQHAYMYVDIIAYESSFSSASFSNTSGSKRRKEMPASPIHIVHRYIRQTRSTTLKVVKHPCRHA